MRVAALAVIQLAGTLGAAGQAVDAAVPACPDVALVEDLGRACRQPSGLLEMFAEDGTSLGTTHGPDRVTPSDLVPPSALSVAEPACVDPLSDPYHVRVLYARAYDDEDRYADSVAPIRDGIRAGLGTLSSAAVATGAGGATLELVCESGSILVENVTLPTARAAATFESIVSDLHALGYVDGRQKLWVLYDDPSACTCGGYGHIWADDSASVGNDNNGNTEFPTVAVNFGYAWSARLWLHELSHNLGAVQKFAPHTTGGWHCTDGRDTMCYADDGPLGSWYTSSACSVEVYDCGKDDYFNLQPEPDTYLSRKWNLGHLRNRYLVVTGIPRITLHDPAPGAVYSGCAMTTPRAPAAAATYAVVVDRLCVRLDVTDVAAAEVRVFVGTSLVASATEPVSVDEDGTQHWQLDTPHGAAPGIRTVRIEATGINGFVTRGTEALVLVAH